MSLINKNVITLFCNVKQSLDADNNFGKKKFRDYFIKALYKNSGKHIKAYMNYNCFALCFNRIYFWKNFLKNLLFFDRYYFLIKDTVLDVGCGAAPASIAIASLAFQKQSRKLNISLIDKSEKQLFIARHFLVRIPVEVKSYKAGCFVFEPKLYDELVVFSYFVCEQKKEFINQLFQHRKNFRNGFVVIDYRDNIELINSYFKKNGDGNIKTVFLKYKLPPVLEHCIGEKAIKVYGCYYKK